MGSRSDSRRRRGASRWSRSRVEFARSSTRGARTSRSCAGWARERRGRRRWLRTGRGELRSDHEKTSSVLPSATVPFPGSAGEKIRGRGRGRRTSARGTGLRDGRAHRARRRRCRARRRRPRGSRVDGRGEKWAPPGLRGETWRVKFSAAGSAENSSGVARQHVKCATNRTPGTDAGRRSVTGRFREIPLESIFPDFSPHGTLTDEDSNC